MSRTPGLPLVIVFVQMTPGRRKSILDESAEADSGGGAKDLRFRGYEQMRPAIAKLLLGDLAETAGEDDVIQGRVTWGNGCDWHDVEFKPPYEKRQGEGRFATVYKWPPLQDIPESMMDDAQVQEWSVLFVRDDNGVVWVRYADVDGLKNSSALVRDTVSVWLQKAPSNKAAVGFIDLTDGLHYWCNVQ